MAEADIGIAISDKNDMLKKASSVTLKNISYIVECMQFGRKISNNVRKFMLYQAIIAINLTIYMTIGFVRYLESPIAPSTILYLNFIMDTMAGI